MLFVMLLTWKGSPSQRFFPPEEMVTQRECEFTHAFSPQDGEFIMTSDERISVLGFLLVVRGSVSRVSGENARLKDPRKAVQNPGYEVILRDIFRQTLCSAAERTIMRSAEYLSISRAEVDFQPCDWSMLLFEGI